MRIGMMWTIVFFRLLFPGAEPVSAQVQFPHDHFVPGWVKSDPEQVFRPETLFDYIDGGAEIFLEFGFQECHVQPYQQGDREIVLELYRMKSPLAALGIYLMRKGDEKPDTLIEARNSATRYQVLAIKGRYLVQANLFSGDRSLSAVARKALNTMLAQIEAETPPDLLTLLPAQNRIAGSEALICGPFSLQPIYTFGEGDVFGLNGEIFGVAAEYGKRGERDSLIIVIPYPDPERAAAAFQHLLENLDSYLNVIKQETGFLQFEDYKQRVGSIRLRRELLKIVVRERPEKR